MLELYHWEPNGSFLKPLILLHEKGLEFRSRYIDVLAGEQYGGGFIDPSPETRLPLEGEGPILVHDGKQIAESLFIMEYLEDAFPATSLRPADPILHAKILAWGRFINEVFMPAVATLGCRAFLVPRLNGREKASMSQVLERIPTLYLREGWRSALANDYPKELIEDSHRKVALGVRRIEEGLGGTQWLVGSNYSLADIDAFAICNSLPRLVPDVVNAEATPRMMKWLERIRSRSAVSQSLAVSLTGRPE